MALKKQIVCREVSMSRSILTLTFLQSRVLGIASSSALCTWAVTLDFMPLLHLSLLSQQFQSFSQYRCKTAKKSEEEIDFLRSNPKIWNVHSVLNVLHSLVDKSNINRQLEVYTSGGECCLPSVPREWRPQEVRRSRRLLGLLLLFGCEW